MLLADGIPSAGSMSLWVDGEPVDGACPAVSTSPLHTQGVGKDAMLDSKQAEAHTRESTAFYYDTSSCIACLAYVVQCDEPARVRVARDAGSMSNSTTAIFSVTSATLSLIAIVIIVMLCGKKGRSKQEIAADLKTGDGATGMFANSLHDWFHGPLSITDAETKLTKAGSYNGLFLVWSTNPKTGTLLRGTTGFMISYVFDSNISHVSVLFDNNKYRLKSMPEGLDSMTDLINRLREQPCGLPVILGDYVNRFDRLAGKTGAARAPAPAAQPPTRGIASSINWTKVNQDDVTYDDPSIINKLDRKAQFPNANNPVATPALPQMPKPSRPLYEVVPEDGHTPPTAIDLHKPDAAEARDSIIEYESVEATMALRDANHRKPDVEPLEEFGKVNPGAYEAFKPTYYGNHAASSSGSGANVQPTATDDEDHGNVTGGTRNDRLYSNAKVLKKKGDGNIKSQSNSSEDELPDYELLENDGSTQPVSYHHSLQVPGFVTSQEGTYGNNESIVNQKPSHPYGNSEIIQQHESPLQTSDHMQGQQAPVVPYVNSDAINDFLASQQGLLLHEQFADSSTDDIKPKEVQKYSKLDESRPTRTESVSEAQSGMAYSKLAPAFINARNALSSPVDTHTTSHTHTHTHTQRGIDTHTSPPTRARRAPARTTLASGWAS